MQILKPVLLFFFTLQLVFSCNQINATDITAFGPEQFVRTAGAPDIFTATFTAHPGEARFILSNGEADDVQGKNSRNRSAVVSLNGTVLFSQDDFNQQNNNLEAPVTLQNDNILLVKLESIPGSFITIEIVQPVADSSFDILATNLQVNTEYCPDTIDLTLRLTNNGATEIPAGMQTAFYNGNPTEGGLLLGTATNSSELLPTDSQDITFHWLTPTGEQAIIFAWADDDGTGTGLYQELDESNNLLSTAALLCPPVSPAVSSVAGTVTNAFEGTPLSGVQTAIYIDENGAAGDVVASRLTDSSGSFLYTDLLPGSYILTAAHPGYADDQLLLTLDENVTLTDQDLPLSPLPLLTLQASPVTLTSGEQSILSWTSTYADQITLDQDIGEVSLQGSLSVTPAATTIYSAIATGPGGTISKDVTITVTFPLPTAAINADPIAIKQGDPVILSWSTTSAESVTITPDIGTVETSGSLTLFPAADTTYTISADGPGGTSSDQVTVTVTQPVPTAAINADPAVITPGETTTLTWNSQYADLCTIEPEIGTVPCLGEMTVAPVQDTTYILSATGAGGTTTAQATVTVTANSISLSITSPSPDDIISRPDVMVRGTINHADGLETGVVVNGVVALVYDGQFVANHVPLETGENTITVKALDIRKNSVEKTITLTTEATDQYVKLISGKESSLSPLETNIMLVNDFTVAGSTSFTYSGPGAVEFVPLDESSYSIKLTAPGLYTFTATAEDEFGEEHSDSVGVLVLDSAKLDTLLQAKWNGMKAGLSAGNITAATDYFDQRSRERYAEIYTALAEKLPQLAADMQDIEMIVAKDNYAQYRIRRNETLSGKEYEVTYYVYFTVDLDGLWRIYEY